VALVSRLDEPLVTWGECVVLGRGDQPCGGVIHLHHNADRLVVGLAIAETEWAHDYLPSPANVTVRKAWARLLTLREQWEWEWEHECGADATDYMPSSPPAGYWPQGSTPSWLEDPHGDEVWIATWTT
jgi:hypothetical protein